MAAKSKAPASDQSTFSILDPHAKVDGKTISQWTQDWWTWAAQSPATPNNPLDDTTGQYATLDNSGPVFFIAGTGFAGPGASVERAFTVSHGTPLLVAVLNSFDTLDPPNVENHIVHEFSSNVTSVYASIDGMPVDNIQRYMETTTFFSMGVAKPNSQITALGESAGLHLAGTDITPTRATGYYLMIDNLSVGTHTLEFGGSKLDGFSTHVVDHITVV